jgi:hypothetical protein
MPDLSERIVTDWFTSLRRANSADEWPPPVRPIEQEADVPARLVATGNAFESHAADDLALLSAALRYPPLHDSMTVVMAQLGAARVTRLLHWFAECGLPECHMVIAALLRDDTEPGRALRAAVEAVTRRAILDRMFGPDRIATLAAACELANREAA